MPANPTLTVHVRLEKTSAGISTSFLVENPESIQDFGPWLGLPETIQALLQVALLLETRLQILQDLERTPTLDGLESSVAEMFEQLRKALLPPILQRCLSERRMEEK